MSSSTRSAVKSWWCRLNIEVGLAAKDVPRKRSATVRGPASGRRPTAFRGSVCDAVHMTHGGRGARVHRLVRHVGARRRRLSGARDRSDGAGDCFLAGFAVGLCAAGPRPVRPGSPTGAAPAPSRWPASPSSSIYRPSVEPPLQLPSSVQKTRPPAEREGAGSGTRVLGPPPDDGAVGAYEQTASTELARLVDGKGGRSAALARRCDNLDIGMADRIQAGRMDDGVRAPVAYHG